MFASHAWAWVLAVIAAYLCGAVSGSIIVSKIFYKDDIRKHGSGNAGTTNMLRTYGKKAAGLTFIGDMLKGIIAVLIGKLLVSISALNGFLIHFFFVLNIVSDKKSCKFLHESHIILL